MTSRPPDLVCLSHLRWNFVFQRPHHLMTRFARDRRVFFVEEPERAPVAGLAVSEPAPGITLVAPCVPDPTDEQAAGAVRELLDGLFAARGIVDYVLWYYTPMALPFTRHLAPLAVVYDCMDELSGFAGAPPALRQREAQLLARAGLVFTGGQTLYEAKRGLHPNVHAFPSSVDIRHFGQTRTLAEDPPDQAGIPRPRLGYFGVIDERMDLGLIAGVAAARPDWQLVLLGPVAKIDPAVLPVAPNVHYLGPRRYEALPVYLAGWDVALLPFARNDATRYISPTKTPEYLAAGRPVVSTSIRDVVTPYGDRGLVRIADTVPAFVAAVEAALGEDRTAWLADVDRSLAGMSWDDTWSRMNRLVEAVVARRRGQSPVAVQAA